MHISISLQQQKNMRKKNHRSTSVPYFPCHLSPEAITNEWPIRIFSWLVGIQCLDFLIKFIQATKEQCTKKLKIVVLSSTTNKESYSTANESKRQFNRFIIYYLNIVPMVNDNFWRVKKMWKKCVWKKCAAEARTRIVWASHWSLML